MQCVASTPHTTSEHGVSSITTADAHTSAASSRLNLRPLADLNGLVRFARKTKSGFCACAITFQLACTYIAANVPCLHDEKRYDCLYVTVFRCVRLRLRSQSNCHTNCAKVMEICTVVMCVGRLISLLAGQ